MRFPHIKKLDLQLLYYLAVLLEEKHVTRAAARCFLSQSAMSRQLDHLREALGDELLLRNGRSHERTARGERLLRDLESMLPRLEEILEGRGFDPASSRDRFQVAMTDYACAVMLPELVNRISNAAPSTLVDVQPWHENCLEDLRRGRLDTVITVAGLSAERSVCRETIFSDEFVCVVSANKILGARPNATELASVSRPVGPGRSNRPRCLDSQPANCSIRTVLIPKMTAIGFPGFAVDRGSPRTHPPAR
jgi:DNA-binding transcriptional LysR family regulator